MNSKPQMTHKKFSASAMKRIIGCPASVKECETAPPSKSSKYAEEGTYAHSVAEAILKGEPHDCKDEGMLAYVKLYTDYVLEQSAGKSLLIEQKFALDFIHKDLGGTNDACIIDPFNTLEIVDLKYGAGVPVEVEDNPQLLTYAVGALWNESLGRLDDEFQKVIVTIVQPRCIHEDGPIRSKEYSFQEVEEFSKKSSTLLKLVLFLS